MTPPKPEPPGRLVSEFKSRSRDEQAAGWDSLWNTDEDSLWDRGKPSPALVDFIESKPDVIQSSGKTLRALVPGCGKGYDVAMLALHGFDVVGLEVSEKGAQVARDLTSAELKSPQEHNFGDAKPSAKTGSITIITGDFFSRDWEKDGATEFDLVYDYTFLCALLPEMRKDWGRRMKELLAPTGVLVCLEFPMYKDLTLPGPPWGLRGVHWDVLAEGKDGMIEKPGTETESASGPFKRVVYFQPPRTYERGQGTDMLSAWVLR